MQLYALSMSVEGIFMIEDGAAARRSILFLDTLYKFFFFPIYLLTYSCVQATTIFICWHQERVKDCVLTWAIGRETIATLSMMTSKWALSKTSTDSFPLDVILETQVSIFDNVASILLFLGCYLHLRLMEYVQHTGHWDSLHHRATGLDKLPAWGPIFKKNLMRNLRKTYEKVWLTKNLQKLMKNLARSYAKLMKNLRRHYRYLTKT